VASLIGRWAMVSEPMGSFLASTGLVRNRSHRFFEKKQTTKGSQFANHEQSQRKPSLSFTFVLSLERKDKQQGSSVCESVLSLQQDHGPTTFLQRHCAGRCTFRAQFHVGPSMLSIQNHLPGRWRQQGQRQGHDGHVPYSSTHDGHEW
jgi:hypothetical protein